MFIYGLRHPECRFFNKLSRLNRKGLNDFLDTVARDALLTGEILEVGCGKNFDNQTRFRPLAKRYWRTDIVDHGDGRLDMVCDCAALPFPPNSLTAIICSEVLEHVPEFSRSLAEFRRTLKGDGYLILSMPFFYPLHGIDKAGSGDFWRMSPYKIRTLLAPDFDVVRETSIHLYDPNDCFVTGYAMLLRRKVGTSIGDGCNDG
jgi:SAM-dependent methyltransferase